MNERIRELCSKAISDVDGIQNPDTQHMYIPACFRDRFAELIVAECAEIALVDGQSTGNFDTFNKIQKHFGVEE